MPVTGAEIKTAVDLIAMAHKQGWLEKLLDAFKKKHHILVLGVSGTGKSNFINSLTELLPNVIDRLNRSEYLKNNAIKISGEPFIFIDTPGQERHISKRMAAYRAAMKNGVSGVINVVSYGYHEGPAVITDVFDERGIVKESFLRARRDIEIGALREWSTHLGSTDVTGWLMTVVTKADLWWSSKAEVFAHYESGEYDAALKLLQSLNSSVLAYCSVVHKFYGTAPVSGDFEDSDRLRLRGHLLGQLLAAIGR